MEAYSVYKERMTAFAKSDNSFASKLTFAHNSIIAVKFKENF